MRLTTPRVRFPIDTVILETNDTPATTLPRVLMLNFVNFLDSRTHTTNRCSHCWLERHSRPHTTYATRCRSPLTVSPHHPPNPPAPPPNHPHHPSTRRTKRRSHLGWSSSPLLSTYNEAFHAANRRGYT